MRGVSQWSWSAGRSFLELCGNCARLIYCDGADLGAVADQISFLHSHCSIAAGGEPSDFRGGRCWWRSWPFSATTARWSLDGGLLHRKRLLLRQAPPPHPQLPAGYLFRQIPAISSFRLLLAQQDVVSFEVTLPDWMAAQPDVAGGLDNLVCDDKTLGAPSLKLIPARYDALPW